MKDYQKHLEALEAHLVLKNYSSSTRSAYRSALRQFFKWRDHQGFNGAFAQSEAREYILHRYKQGRKWQTINGDYSALLRFFREVLKIEWDVQHIPRPRKERSLPRILSMQEVRKLIEHGATFKHQVFMSLLYGTGLRLGEALRLSITDIDGQRLQIRVQRGKGAKDRYVQMPPCLLPLLRQYYRLYHPVKYLFNGKVRGQEWAARSAQHAITSARKQAGVERQVSPHVFRHCYATHHLEAGTNLVYLKRQLGHKNLKTTAKYIQLCQQYHFQVQHPIADMAIRYQASKI